MAASDDRDAGSERPAPGGALEARDARSRHACAFFHGPDEEHRVLLPFIREGLEQGEKALHIVDPRLRHEYVQRLRGSGIDVARAEREGRFELRDWNESYWLGDGRFDATRMLALLEEMLEGARRQGFPRTRLVSHMEWSKEDATGASEIAAYETRFNLAHPHCRDWIICAYDLSRFGADVVIDVMRTHPMILVGGVLQENPFFVPPEELLGELPERSR